MLIYKEPERNSYDGRFPTGISPRGVSGFCLNVDPDLINRSSDLANRFRLLCAFGGDDMSLLCVPPGLFD